MHQGDTPPRAVLRTGGRGFRGPFVRWPRLADGVLAIGIYVLSVVFNDGPGGTLTIRGFGELPWYAHALFAVGTGALWWRRRAPLAVIGVVLLTWFVLLPAGLTDHGGALLVALYSVGRYSDRDGWGEVAVLGASVGIVLDGLGTPLPASDLVAGVVFMAGAWTFGRARRLRIERTEHYRREQEAERARVVAEERTRIARELHDVVAHRVSLMTVQAGAARAVASTDPAGADRAMAAVEDTGRQALDELRQLLGVLRPAVDGEERDPQPGLADLPRLVERIRAAGLDVEVTLQEVPDGLPAAVELSAHRIVQEALTNVIKHAGDGARAEVRVQGAAGGLEVEVRDDGGDAGTAPTPRGAPGPGHGIIGMRERAALLGGSLRAGPMPGGGFRVAAHLPVATRADREEAPA